MPLYHGLVENRRPTTAEKLNMGMQQIANAVPEYMENEAINRQIGLNLSGIKDPNTRSQLIADQLTFGRKSKQAQASQGVDYSLRGQEQVAPERTQEARQQFLEETQPPPKRKPIEFLNRQKSEITEGKGPGNQPQSETQGLKGQILTPEQVIQRGQQIAAEQSAAGIPTSVSEGIDIAKMRNEEQRQYNRDVDLDVQQRVNAQRQYGQIAEKELQRVMGDQATGEQIAMFKKKAENAAQINRSEADIQKEMAREAKNFKNTLANVRNSISPIGFMAKIKRGLLGTEREEDKAKRDIRMKLAPLLNEGLYDTARDVLSELGYGPEQRESAISDLGEGARKNIATLPKFDHPEPLKARGFRIPQKRNWTAEELGEINSNMSSIFQADPSTNLVLLRKAYQDKGVPWDVFKDTLDDLMGSGQIKLGPDQYFSQYNYLDSPPLNELDKILHGLNLIGK